MCRTGRLGVERLVAMGWVIKKLRDPVAATAEIEAIEAELDRLTHRLEALRAADARDRPARARSRATLHDSPLGSLFRATSNAPRG